MWSLPLILRSNDEKRPNFTPKSFLGTQEFSSLKKSDPMMRGKRARPINGFAGLKILKWILNKANELSVGTFVPSHVSGCPHHDMCIPPTGYLVIFWWGWVGLRGFTIFQPNPALYFVEKVYSEYIRIRSLWDGHVNLISLYIFCDGKVF